MGDHNSTVNDSKLILPLSSKLILLIQHSTSTHHDRNTVWTVHSQCTQYSPPTTTIRECDFNSSRSRKHLYQIKFFTFINIIILTCSFQKVTGRINYLMEHSWVHNHHQMLKMQREQYNAIVLFYGHNKKHTILTLQINVCTFL